MELLETKITNTDIHITQNSPIQMEGTTTGEFLCATPRCGKLIQTPIDASNAKTRYVCGGCGQKYSLQLKTSIKLVVSYVQ